MLAGTRLGRRWGALVAFGAAVAFLGHGAASAPAAFEFKSEGEHTVVTGSSIGSQVLKTNQGEELTCKTATLAGTAKAEAKAVKELLLAPTYGECKFKSGSEEFTADVAVESCSKSLVISKTSQDGHRFNGPLQIKCGKPEESIKIEITVLGTKYGCLAVGPQEAGGVVDYTNGGAGSGRDIGLAYTLSGIDHTRTGVCGEGAPGTATLGGEATLSGETEGKAALGLWIGEGSPEFRSEAEHTVVTGPGLGSHVLKTVPGEELTCKTSTLSGTVKAATKSATELTLGASYGECKFKSGSEELNAHVNMGSCLYRLAPLAVVEEGHRFSGSAVIDCTKAGDAIRIEITILGKKLGCLALPEQTPGGAVEYTRQGDDASRDLKMTANLSGISYVREGACGEGSGTSATYGGEATLSGETEAKEAVGIWVGEEKAPHFHVEAEHQVLDGKALGSTMLTTGTGSITCSKAEATGTTSAKGLTEITATLHYTECTGLVGGSTLPALVESKTCDQRLRAETTAPATHRLWSIGCSTGGDEMHFKLFILGAYRPCYKIPAQTPSAGGSSYSNEGSGATRTVRVKTTAEGVEYTKEGVCGAGTAKDGTLQGEVTLSATDTSGNHKGIWFE